MLLRDSKHFAHVSEHHVCGFQILQKDAFRSQLGQSKYILVMVFSRRISFMIDKHNRCLTAPSCSHWQHDEWNP